MKELRVEIADAVMEKHPGIHLATEDIDVRVTKEYDTFKVEAELRRSFTVRKEELKNHPVVRALRDFYWRIGIDPTKVRPSSEALARRLLSGQPLPRINNVVDAGNYASVETLIPIGIYDLGRVVGPLSLRFARGEAFIDIASGERRLRENEIVLADFVGPIHIFPHRDAGRTMVQQDTNRVLIVGCGVQGVEPSLTHRAVLRMVELLRELSP